MIQPTQAQIDAAANALRGLVVLTGDSAWDMDYVARKVLTAAAEVGGVDFLCPKCGSRGYIKNGATTITAAAEVGYTDLTRKQMVDEIIKLHDEIDGLTAAAEVSPFFECPQCGNDLAQIEAAFKPCPFCGSKDIRCTNHGKVSHDPMHRDDDVWSMCCYQCGATFPNRYRRELLIENWNRRSLTAAAEQLTIEHYKKIEEAMDAIIERCAQVAEKWTDWHFGPDSTPDVKIAAAIRALKG